MALPPEQINIKRRREEEPVDTLYIQSEVHQTKRRFTDYIFERVRHGGIGNDSPSPSLSRLSAAQQALRSPRSVSSSNVFPTATGVPLVRATSPGAEFRDAQRLAAARRDTEEKYRKALYSSPVPPETLNAPSPKGPADVSPGVSSVSSGRASPASWSGKSASVRKFQISRSSTPGGLKTPGSGIQKRRAILVEKLRHKTHSRKASMVDLALKAQNVDLGISSLDGSLTPDEEPARPRKRPVVNQAEKRWREERKAAISAAKQNISDVLEKEAQVHQRSWDDESERLAHEFEQIALELEGSMEVTPTRAEQLPTPSAAARSIMPKPALKYQPRSPKKPRVAASSEAVAQKQASIGGDGPNAMDVVPSTPGQEDEDDDSDGDYVYDTYIRRPLPDGVFVTNPLVDMERDQDAWLRQNGIDTTRPDVGVIVITQEDEEYWEHFAEDEEDEDRWDSEDADSNAENNPANDYPDEELSSDGENDDPTAIYTRYRRHAASDDEEYDMDDYDSDGGVSGRREFGFHRHLDSDEESY